MNVKKDVKGVFLVLIILLVVFYMFVNLDNRNVVKENTSTEIEREKIISSICIEKNSTLWDIATEYYTEEYKNMDELIEEIKISNGMTTDTIHAGHYLIVPHYVSYE